MAKSDEELLLGYRIIMMLSIVLLDGSVVSHYTKGILERNCFVFQVNLCLDLTSDSMIYNSSLFVKGPAISLTVQ